MDHNQRFLNFLGLGARAGKLSYGAEACAAGIKNGKVKLLVLDGEASDNTKKQFEDSCRFYRVPIIVLEGEDAGVLGSRLGKPGNKVIGIVCADFAKSALGKYGTASGGEKFE